MITLATDTYITLVDARAYADANVLSLPADDTECETLLKRAAVALDRKYGAQYLGYKQMAQQPKGWPRFVWNPNSDRYQDQQFIADSDGNPRDFTANSGIPFELGQAQVELAVLIDGGFDPLEQPAGMADSTYDRIDTLETRRTFASGYMQDNWYSIKLILRPVLRSAFSDLQWTRGA